MIQVPTTTTTSSSSQLLKDWNPARVTLKTLFRQSWQRTSDPVGKKNNKSEPKAIDEAAMLGKNRRPISE